MEGKPRSERTAIERRNDDGHADIATERYRNGQFGRAAGSAAPNLSYKSEDQTQRAEVDGDTK